MSQSKPLYKKYPKRLDIPALIFLSLALLAAGINLPILKTEKLIFWEENYTILSSSIQLLKDGSYVLAIIIILFSILFPFLKLFSLVAIWFLGIKNRLRGSALRWLEITGSWSMLDVFVVAIFIVVAKTSGLSDAKPKPGLYIFGGAILLSMIVTTMIKFLEKKSN